MIAILGGYSTNVASIQFALKRLGKQSTLTTDKKIIQSASHVILPGISTAKHAMTELHHLELVDVIKQLQQPVLGICLGMQLFFEFSTEGDVACLGLLPGKVSALLSSNTLPVPHMGWNQLDVLQPSSALMKGIASGDYVYFVHGYAVPSMNATIATMRYGAVFSASIQYGHFYGVQFHPEKSGPTGAKILHNFLELH